MWHNSLPPSVSVTAGSGSVTTGDDVATLQEGSHRSAPPIQPSVALGPFSGSITAGDGVVTLQEGSHGSATPIQPFVALGSFSGSITTGDGMVTSQEGSHGSAPPIQPSVALGPVLHSWPAETDLVLVAGSNKIMLTVQPPLLRVVFQDAFDRIRAALLFTNAFPDVFATVEMIRDSLISSAELNDHVTNIHSRLLGDVSYANSMSHLVSLSMWNPKLLTSFQPCACVPLFRGEVKDRCAAIIQAEFLSLGSSDAVTKVVEKQLASYNYTFPKSSNVHVTLQLDSG